MSFISINRNAPDIRALVTALTGIPLGGTITYDELSTAIGRDVTRHRYLVLRAMSVANAESGALFAPVRKVGYRRLPMDEAPSVGQTARRRIRRASRQARKRMLNAAAKANDLPADIARKVNAELSALGLIEHLTRDKTAELMKAPEPMPLAIATDAVAAQIRGA